MLNKIIIVLVWIVIGIALVWGVGAWVMKTRPGASVVDVSNPLGGFARCLTNNGVKMYGADWCPHCQDQKKAFGDAFKFVDYIECADPVNPRVQAKACSDADITGYPTWIFADGKRIEGKASFDQLAIKSGCEYKK